MKIITSSNGNRWKTVTLFSLISTLGFSQGASEKLKANIQQKDAYLGYSVDISGDFAVAGAYMEDNETSYKQLNTGAAYLYFNTGGSDWTQVQKLMPSTPKTDECFGNAVSISGDKIIIGAVVSDDQSENAGAVYIFEKGSDQHWQQTAKLFAEDPAPFEFFGFSVAIEGNTAFAGAIQDGTGSGTQALSRTGAVYVMQKDRLGEWKQKQKITAPDATDEDFFGYTISVSGDQLFIGSYAQDGDEKNGDFKNSAGAVYVYVKQMDGHWKFSQKLVASNREKENYFGSALSVSGNQAAIGAHKRNSETTRAAGAVYIFEKDEKGKWNEKQIITNAAAKQKAHFGYSVSLSGTDLIVGSCYKLDIKNEGAPESGFAALYKMNEKGVWENKDIIKSNEKSYDNWLGYSVAMDGGKYIIGAHKDGTDELTKSGAVYFRGECKSTFKNIVAESCVPYELNGKTYAQSGNYQIVIPNASGCDSVITLNLTIHSINAEVVSENGIFRAAEENASYQWYNHTLDQPVKKANKKIFIPVKDGNYSVIVSKNGCVDTSATQTFFKVEMEMNSAMEVNVFPNPVSDILNVQLGNDYEKMDMILTDLSGKIVYQQTITSTRFFTLDMSLYPVGTYLMSLQAGDEVTVVKVIKN